MDRLETALASVAGTLDAAELRRVACELFPVVNAAADWPWLTNVVENLSATPG